MNKFYFSFPVVFTLAVGACYQKTPTNTLKPTQTSATSTPLVEKTAEPLNQTSKGDFNAAMDYFRSKNYEKAAAELEAVVKDDAKHQQAQLHLGRSYKALKKTDEAVGAYKKAVELKPDDAEANYELGKIYLDKKDYAASLPFIEKAAKIKYTSVEYLVALGDNYRELKKCDYAVVPYGKVPGFDEKNTAALYGMGLCYIELKNRIAAATQVRNLEKLDKDLAKKLEEKIPK